VESSAQPPVSPPPAVDVVVLDPGDLVSAGALVGRVWGMQEAYGGVDFQTLRAYLLAGEPLLGAYLAGRAHDAEALVGTSIAFVGTHLGGVHIHSHITGVEPSHQHRGVGAALKLAQRDWGLARGITEVRWTFDPLVARNAFFNLTKLGARGTAYFVDVYGSMPDATNAGDESDRVEAVWDLTASVGRRVPDLDELLAAGAEVILSLDGEVWRRTPLVPTLLACTPTDVAALRRDDPAAALAWRRAARDAIGRALDLGYVATGATRDGWWVLQAGDADAMGNEAE
jgi:predicted GNAT superfamily acetyltransferase